MKIFFSKLKFDIINLDAMIARNSGSLAIVLTKLITICKGRVTRSTLLNIKLLLVKLQNLRLSQNEKGMVLYLKACIVALQQHAVGYSLRDIKVISGAKISRCNSGLPRIIPRDHRFLLHNGTPFQKAILYKFYMSIFNLYRFIYYKPTGSLSSITNPSKFDFGISRESFIKYMHLFIGNLPFNSIMRPFDKMRSYLRDPYSIHTASAGRARGSESNDHMSLPATFPSSICHNLVAIRGQPSISRSLIKINTLLDNTDLLGLLEDPYYTKKNMDIPLVPGGGLYIGKLSFKLEPAGKLRIFAMVDAPTNWTLQPLHSFIFKAILCKLPMDGTFDQIRPINRLMKRKCTGLYSVDLSSATDRLPVSLQQELLSLIFNSEFADH